MLKGDLDLQMNRFILHKPDKNENDAMPILFAIPLFKALIIPFPLLILSPMSYLTINLSYSYINIIHINLKTTTSTFHMKPPLTPLRTQYTRAIVSRYS